MPRVSFTWESRKDSVALGAVLTACGRPRMLNPKSAPKLHVKISNTCQVESWSVDMVCPVLAISRQRVYYAIGSAPGSSLGIRI